MKRSVLTDRHDVPETDSGLGDQIAFPFGRDATGDDGRRLSPTSWLSHPVPRQPARKRKTDIGDSGPEPLSAAETQDALKARFSPGDRIVFGHRRRSIEGVVVNLGPRRASIRTDEGVEYRVPYGVLRSLEPVVDHREREQQTLATCRGLMLRYGLWNWSAGLDDAKQRAGICDYSRRRISLSRLFVRRAGEEAIIDTILHEIAHALVGPDHNHDAVWRVQARAIGCSGDRCHDLSFTPPRWILRCPNGCFVTTGHRRRSGVCRNCRMPPEHLPWTEERARTLGVEMGS